MSFVYPWILIVMLIPFLIFSVLILTNKDGAGRVFSSGALKRLRVDGAKASLCMKTRSVMILLAILLMIFALARPVVNDKEQEVDAEGMDVLIALDISTSMRSEDNYPNRLSFAKTKIAQLLKAMQGSDAVEVLAFAHSSFLIAPLTQGKDVLLEMINGVSENDISQGSTNFEILAESVSGILKDKEPKILVIFSDGGDKKSLAKFQSVINDNKVVVYAVLVGTKQGAPVLDKRGKMVKKKDGTVAMTQVNKELGNIATNSGGSYVMASNGAGDMQALVKQIRSKFGNKKKGKTKVIQRDELFVYPLIIAVLLLLFSLSSLPVARRSK